MNDMTVKEIVEEWLEGYGYGGLFNECGDPSCGCILGDLMLCSGDQSTCEPAYAFFCSRCAKKKECDRRSEECEWMTSPSKDYCEPDYTAAAPAAACAAQSAALSACVPLTVGEVARAGLHPLHEQGGVVEARVDALKVEPGDLFIDLFGILKGEPPVKEACQNTAKNDDGVTIYPDIETALRAVRKGFLQLGA